MKPNPIIFLCGLLLLTGASRAQQAVEFVANKGQWGSWLQYKAATRGADVLLEKDGLRYIMCDAHNNPRMDSFHHAQTRVSPVLKFHCYKAAFIGSNPQVKITGEKPYKVYYNYFLGNDYTRWKSGIHPDRAVNYDGLYAGINMHVGSDKNTVVYDFTVQPDADPSQIKLSFTGQDNLYIDKGNLMIHTSVGDATEMKPYAYQYVNDKRVEVPCEYTLQNNVISFSLADYDHSKILFIDPTVVFCTMTGSTADNWGFTATYDDAGYFYNGGLVNCLTYLGAYPVSPGAFQVTFGGGYGVSWPLVDSTYASDIAIIKYDPTGVDRIYATYLGGSGNERPTSMIVDPSGDLIVAGRTESTDFPVTPGAFQTTNGGNWDIILTKFNPTATALIGSTYLGGSQPDGVNFDSSEWGFGDLKFNYGDDARSEVQIDKLGNIYVAGCTNSTNFPITAGTALSTALSGVQDGIVCKFNSTLTTMLWGTYVGGNNADAAYVLNFDTSQASLYVAGGTISTNFPTTAGTLHTAYQGGRADGFILKFQNSPPYTLQKGTYVGTSNYDQIFGIQVSDDNHVYVMGQSLGGTFPVTAGVYSNASSSQFIMETDSNLTTDLISTVYGNSDPDSTNISPVAFLVDTCGNVYISGWGGDLGITSAIEATGTAVGMPVTSDAIRASSPLGRDFYFIVLGPDMTTLRYATYYGRSCPGDTEIWEGCHVDGGTSRFNKQGIIYQAMCADCGGVYNATRNPTGCMEPFPTTSGVWSMVDSSANCNEAALKIAFNIGPVDASVTAFPDTSGCAPLTVTFTNTSTNALTYVWNFGDGSPTSTSSSSVSHTFTSAGTYTVTLAAANSNSCFVTNDTAHLVIVVDTNAINPAFSYALTDSCGPFVATFTNSSVSHVSGDTSSYTWLFGDGSSYTGTTPPAHTYADSGTYVAYLIMANSGACQSPDTVTQTLSFHPFLVSAKFSTADSVCLGTPFALNSTITNSTSAIWNFGNGYTSASASSYVYDSAAIYTITLIAQNSGSCNKADTATWTISALPIPTANFTFTPTTAEANVPTVFTNLSTNASSYSWNFGDNTTSNETNPTHQYDKTGVYTACLTAYNSDNCPAQVCKLVPTDVDPIVGIPSGFSPNGDGENDILYVRGAAIATMDLKIYNRWGQLVFESTSQDVGWDGTYNGKPQPIDAYAYVLNVTFIDGTGKILKGNITLLR